MSATTEIKNLLVCLVQNMAADVGGELKDLRDQIAALAAMDNASITEIQAKLQTLQDLLDSDPNTEGFQTAQNLINTITGLTARIVSLESGAADTATQLTDLGGQITSLEGQLQTLQAQVAAGGTGGQECDCAALNAAISEINTTLANLTGTDTGQAAQIADLQSRIGAVETAVSGIAGLQQTITAMQATDAAQQSAINALQNELAELSTLSCTELTANWRGALNAAMNPAGN